MKFFFWHASQVMAYFDFEHALLAMEYFVNVLKVGCYDHNQQIKMLNAFPG